jgi:hypothetical protein
MKIEKIVPKELDELSCVEEVGVAGIDGTPCLIAKGPKKDGTIHYTVIQADLIGECLHQLFGPMNEFFGSSTTQSNN